MRLLIVLIVMLCFFPGGAMAQDSCSYDALADQSVLIGQGFIDSSVQILNDPAQAQKAKQVLANVQRIYLHQPSQSVLLYGWGSLPEELVRDIEKNSLLIQRMEKLKREAISSGHSFNYRLLPGQPVTATFDIAYAGKKWPQREAGIEIVANDDCWVTVKLGGNRLSDSQADRAFLSAVEQEWLRIRSVVLNDTRFPNEMIAIKPLPGFNADNFWAFSLPTLILAFLFGTIIGRAATSVSSQHVTAYFRLMTLMWIAYALIISLFKADFLGSEYSLSLEHYVYAAFMISVQCLGLIYGPVMALPSVALALGHATRSALFSMMDFLQAPKIIWFDVGLMVLASLYILFYGFRRRTIGRPAGSKPSVVDRSK